MIPPPRNTAGTQYIPDILRDPRTWWWGVLGGNPAAAEQDLRDLREGLPLRSVAFLRLDGNLFRQGILVMHLAGPERLAWRKWRPFRTFGRPVPLPRPHEVIDVREPSSFAERQLGGVRVLTLRAGTEIWEMAVVAIDVPVVMTALAEAESWAPDA
ncbi:hypothetical protein [Nocardiopsis aegyptia]|uniref:Uncharacterized protein n=1 Tax=Nocardiopsis aegyptia TaxID=220378 RepID=A0A7Z0EKG4_9ACTN|nr:hypothetical protein [Nocardiopsis aegyptia]NYJ32890.1 hypothetical protein [Nocardiopsis aegyptia]